MIAEGSLGGYWRRAGSRMTFYVYTEDLEAYRNRYGPLGGKRRKYQQSGITPVSDLSSPDGPWVEPAAASQEISELRSSLATLADRVSALEGMIKGDRTPSPHRRSDIEWEQGRRLELEDALAALEADDALLAEADALNQQAYMKLRSAHMQLRASTAQARQPRTIADLPGIADDTAQPD